MTKLRYMYDKKKAFKIMERENSRNKLEIASV